VVPLASTLPSQRNEGERNYLQQALLNGCCLWVVP
jgi:hypothetical protein